MFGSNDLYHALRDESVCQKYGYDTATIACMFVPNTYDLYWNISVDKFLERMKKESDKFWNFERTEKAKAMKLTPVEIITLASIVDEETANNGEKPMIAGMYYNRLMLRNAEYPEGMPLQADPTIKYAWQRFDLKRIYNNLLSIKSPYNTYKNPGLPPGPIRIPSVAGIDASSTMCITITSTCVPRRISAALIILPALTMSTCRMQPNILRHSTKEVSSKIRKQER